MTAAGAAAGAVSAPRASLVAVVVTFNRLTQLQRTLAVLLEGREAGLIDRVIVVDNASTDGTGAWLAERAAAEGRLSLLTLSENRGGAGGFEAGLREAMARFSPDWCLIMDDDARPLPGCLSRFHAGAGALLAAGWEALATGVHYPDGAICEMNRPSRNPFWDLKSFLRTLFGGGRAGFHVPDLAYEAREPFQIHATSFVGLFLSRAAIARAGYPEGDLFIYGDDVLYTLRLSRAGGRIAFAPWLAYEHDCRTFRRGAGTSRREDHGAAGVHRPMWKVYYNYRNGLFGYRAAAGPLFFWPVLAVVLPKWALKARAYGPEGRLFLRLLRIAVWDGLTNRRNRPHDEVLRLSEAP